MIKLRGKFQIDEANEKVYAFGKDDREHFITKLNERYKFNKKYKRGSQARKNEQELVIPFYASCKCAFEGKRHINDLTWDEFITHLSYELTYSLSNESIAEINESEIWLQTIEQRTAKIVEIIG